MTPLQCLNMHGRQHCSAFALLCKRLKTLALLSLVLLPLTMHAMSWLGSPTEMAACEFPPAPGAAFSMGLVSPKQGLRISSPKLSGQSSVPESAPHTFGHSPFLAHLLPLTAASPSLAHLGALCDPSGILVI